MKILRRGAKADHGFRKVELKNPKLKWNPTIGAFDLSFAGPATDFATDGRHNYTVRQSPQELASQMIQLAKEGSAMDAEEFASIFGPTLSALTKLQIMASGIRLGN